jgi:hypothetical protein
MASEAIPSFITRLRPCVVCLWVKNSDGFKFIGVGDIGFFAKAVIDLIMLLVYQIMWLNSGFARAKLK